MNRLFWLGITAALFAGLILGYVLGYRSAAFDAHAGPPALALSAPAVSKAAAPRSGYVYFSGDIRQCAMPLPPDRSLTASQAIIIDGGVGTFGDPRHIHIQRPQGNGHFAQISFDFKGVVVDGHLDRDIAIIPGDIVVVPERLKNF